MIQNQDSIAVTKVRNVQAGDSIAFVFIGNVDGGVVQSVVYCAYDLKPSERAYMLEQKLDIPKDENEPIATSVNVLLFGHFHSVAGPYKHMYVSLDRTVAVFPKD